MTALAPLRQRGGPTRVAVIGAGHMGALHVSKLHALAAEGEVTLAGVADIDPSRAQAVASAYGIHHTQDFRELLRRADTAIVAVPAVDHYEVVNEALKAGLDVLVEKPIAASLPEAEALLATARSEKRLLQVGHLERFNAAFQTVADSIERPRFIEVHRLGPFPARATDVDVVCDLMIHDLDIILRLVGEEPERVEGAGVAILSSELDIANARLTFPSGCVANVTASRVSPTPMRKVRIFQPDGYFSLDFLENRAAIFRHAGEDDPEPIRMEPLDLGEGDALDLQLRAFLAAVRTREEASVTPEEAMRALRTALRITDAIEPADPSGAAGPTPRT